MSLGECCPNCKKFRPRFAARIKMAFFNMNCPVCGKELRLRGGLLSLVLWVWVGACPLAFLAFLLLYNPFTVSAFLVVPAFLVFALLPAVLFSAIFFSLAA